MQVSIKMPECWREITCSDLPYTLIPTGRVSGKTKNTIIVAVILLLSFPYTDGVVTRSTYGSMGDSAYAEFQAELGEMPEAIRNQFEFKKSPLRIERKDDSGTVYFIGAGGSNEDRTKGLKTKHPVKFAIIEETQEFKTKTQYDQFMASLRRNLGKKVRIFVLGNPPCIEAHWFNKFTKTCENDKDWLVKRMSWEDIIPFLNDYDIKEILKCKILEPDYYQFLYMGVPTGGLQQVYPMFRKDIHLIDYDTRSNSKMLSDFRIVGCIIGCDGAVNKDSTVFVPRFIYSNGQSMAGEIFYHDPKTSGVKGSFPLVENEGKRWFADLIRKNNLDNPNNYWNSIPIVFVVDSAATELIQALRYYMGNRAEVYPIKKGTILQMVDTVQSAIGKNVVGVYDYGGYYNYTLNKWVATDNILAYQYRSLIWNDKQTGYDPIIPNDATDADTYAIYFYYRQVENIIWLQDVVNKRKDYYVLKEQKML